jgi:mRNA-degrading endonuclease toxin of MazEF toxin-antitoxin module
VRGDVYELQADDRSPRYVVVVQDFHIVLPTVVVVPTTASPVGTGWWPEIEIDGTPAYVMAEQVTFIERAHLGDIVCSLRSTELLAVDQRLRDVLGL